MTAADSYEVRRDRATEALEALRELRANVTEENLLRLSESQQFEVLAKVTELDHRVKTSQLFLIYPEETTVQANGDVYPARRLYAKHMEILKAGATCRERCFMAANRLGKTRAVGAFEWASHLTGLYPPWWEGARHERPGDYWACGKSTETIRDIVQKELLGRPVGLATEKTVDGTGMIPPDLIVGRPTWRKNTADVVDTIQIRHVPTGGKSLLGLKSYEQGRGSFEGTAKKGIWNDEEPPMDIYAEELLRTMTTNGILLNTFTPLEGLSEVALHFLPGAKPFDEDEDPTGGGLF